MTNPEINRGRDMEIFIRVVETGSFSAAARTLSLTPSAVSKLISRLEKRLAVRLFKRSTHHMQLTSEGNIFYRHSVEALHNLLEVEQLLKVGRAPAGDLCVTAHTSFCKLCLLPILPVFLARFPDIALSVLMTDKIIDLFEDGIDVAIRTGTLRDSTLVARKLGVSRKVIVGSPAYINRYGMPTKPADLKEHNCLRFKFEPGLNDWPFIEQGEVYTVPVQGNLSLSEGDALHQMALLGTGLARLTDYQVATDISNARLIPLLEAFNPNDTEDIYTLYIGQGAHMPARLRVFLDFLVEALIIDKTNAYSR